MSRIGTYDHLGPLEIPLDMDKLAKLLVEKNYGVHILLSAIVRERRKSKTGNPNLTEGIARLLEEGGY